MNRQIVYPAQQPRSLDFLTSERATMIGLGHLVRTVLGTGTVVDGLACTQTTVPSMQVTVAPGCITSLGVVDGSAYGGMTADSNPLVRMGINEAPTSFTLTAPVTSGQSINYLIEAQFAESDTNSTSLTFRDASTGLPYTATQNTTRQQVVSLQVKNGTAATTGSQTTPSVDSGWVGLYVVTVAYGATTVVNANISLYPGAPFLAAKLPALLPVSGTLGGISATQVYAGNPNGHVAGNAAGSGLPADTCWDTGAGVMYVCTATGTTSTATWKAAAPVQTPTIMTATGSLAVPTWATRVVLDAIAPGGGGGGGKYNSAGASSTAYAGGGGGSGDYVEGATYSVTAGGSVSVVFGSGGTGGAATVNGGAGGNLVIGSLVTLTGGAAGAAADNSSPGAGGSAVGTNGIAGQTGNGVQGVTAATMIGGQGGFSPFGKYGRGGTGGLATMGLNAAGENGGGGYLRATFLP
jgi:hypothetical protein